MRVVHLMAPGPIAGAENVVLHGCAALAERGDDLSLLVMVEERCPEHGRAFLAAARDRGIPADELRVRGRLDLGAMTRLRAVVRESGAELVHAHGYKALIYASLAARAPVVVTHHGETGHDRLARLYEGLARWVYRRVDLVFAVSTVTAELLANAGVPASKIRVVPNPVALQPVATHPDHADSDSSELRLLFVGRLSEEKGLDVLLRALAASNVSSNVSRSMRLDVAGDGPCRAAWMRLADELGLGERVRWLGIRRDVPVLLSRSHVLVLPSRREGLPLVVLEATSSGVPVLASRVGGVPEAVWEGENAVLVRAEDVSAWSNALEALPEQVVELQAGARRRAPEVRARHAPSEWAARTASAYSEIFGPSRTGRAAVPFRKNRHASCFRKAHRESDSPPGRSKTSS